MAMLEFLLMLVEAAVGASGGPRAPRWARVLWIAFCVLFALGAIAAAIYAIAR